MWISRGPNTIYWKRLFLFALHWIVLTSCQNQLSIIIRVYFWIPHSLLLICMYVHFQDCITLFRLLYIYSKFWIWEVWALQHYSSFPRLFWLFRVSWISKWILETACQFWLKKKKLSWNFDKGFLETVGQFWGIAILKKTFSPWKWEIFPFIISSTNAL